MLNRINNRINKWLWISQNKKPPKKYEAYMSTVAMWFLAGMFFGAGIVSVMAVLDESLSLSIAVGLMFLLVIAYVLWVGIRDDKHKGKYDAIHKATIEYWHSKNKEYGIEKKEG